MALSQEALVTSFAKAVAEDAALLSDDSPIRLLEAVDSIVDKSMALADLLIKDKELADPATSLSRMELVVGIAGLIVAERGSALRTARLAFALGLAGRAMSEIAGGMTNTERVLKNVPEPVNMTPCD